MAKRLWLEEITKAAKTCKNKYLIVKQEELECALGIYTNIELEGYRSSSDINEGGPVTRHVRPQHTSAAA